MVNRKPKDAPVARVVFELVEAKVRLVHKSERLEKHGDVDVLAADLDFEFDTDNGVLAMFSPTLRSALYQRPAGPQQDLPETVTPEHLTEVKYPELGVLKWGGGSLAKAALRFHTSPKPENHVVFEEAKVHKYSLDCKEGGTVTVRFQAQVRPTGKQPGRLSDLLLDKHCVVSVTPAGVEAGESSPGEE